MSPDYQTVDEYVWLGNRPIIVVRGRLANSDDERSADDTVVCGRNGETTTCGGRHLLTDSLPKVVAVVDGTRKVAARFDYEVWGAVNRTRLAKSTATPYSAGAYQLLWQAGLAPKVAGAVMETRWKFLAVDTEGTASSPVDGVQLTDLPTVGGYHRGEATSGWRTADAGWVYVRFVSNSTNCGPGGCDGGASWPYAGAMLHSLEYRQRQSGAVQFDVPLRFPGQYFDVETGKHENHNRYYDPGNGRYLSPEPLLQSPQFVRAMAREGLATPTYAYAGNNPIHHTDSTGLCFGPLAPVCIALGLESAGAALSGLALTTAAVAGSICIGTQCLGPTPPGSRMPSNTSSGAEGGTGNSGAGGGSGSSTAQCNPAPKPITKPATTMVCRRQNSWPVGGFCYFDCPDGTTVAVEDEGIGCVHETWTVTR